MALCEKHALGSSGSTVKHREPDPESAKPLESDIRKRAYELYLRRGGVPGDAQSDWLEAEREVRQAMAEAHCPTCQSNR